LVVRGRDAEVVLTHGRSIFTVLVKPEHVTGEPGGVVVPPAAGTIKVTDVVEAQVEPLQAVSPYEYEIAEDVVLAGSESVAVLDVELSVAPFRVHP
jgi:hypothetical protein